MKAALLSALVGAVVGAVLSFFFTNMSNKKNSEREHTYTRTEANRKTVEDLESLLQTMVDDIKTNREADLREKISQFHQNAIAKTYARSLDLEGPNSSAPDLAILLKVISDESLVYIQNCVSASPEGVLQVGTCSKFVTNLNLQAHFDDLNERVKERLDKSTVAN